MELARAPLTRWTAQLLDRDQEQRFRAYNLVAQRRTAIFALGSILTVNAAAFALSLLNGPPGVARTLAHVIGTGIGVTLLVAIGRERRHVWLHWQVSAAMAVLSALVAIVIATGPNMGYRGAILVVGGVAVVYLAMPLQLVDVTIFALAYSAVTVPVWLVVTPAGANVDVVYTLTTVVLAHVLSFSEARRARRERRVLFAQRETLLALSAVDPLTGLMNRRAADSELARAFAYWRRTGAPLAVLMIDIDHFKMLNDTQGHVAGDHALRLVADVIRSVMPMVPGQVAARYGGEEFICLLPGMDAAQATVVAGGILTGVRHIGVPLHAGSTDRTILTVSAGVAAAESSLENAEALVEAADRQLYRAKREGRNCVRTEPIRLRA